MMGNLSSVFIISIVLLAVSGLYCIIISRNLIRVLIGIELLIKV
jgi:NADH:ubiquinone oxidoreductase subunit K